MRRPQNFEKSTPYFWLYVLKSKVEGEDLEKFCGLLRMYELYFQDWIDGSGSL